MRADLVAALVAGMAGGVAGGFAAGRLLPHDKPPPAVRPAASADVRALTAQVAALEAEVARIRQQRGVAAIAARAQADTAAQPADAPQKRPTVDDPVFEAAVRDVVDKLQQERAGEREERRTQGMQKWADKLAEQAGLSEAQKTKALAIAQDLADKIRALRDPDAGAVGQQGFLAQRDALRAQSEEKLREVLSAKQMEIYQASSELHIDAATGRGRGRGDRQ